MQNIIAKIWQDETGATAIEYGLICALIAVAAMAAMQSFAGSTITMWMGVSTNTLNATQSTSA